MSASVGPAYDIGSTTPYFFTDAFCGGGVGEEPFSISKSIISKKPKLYNKPKFKTLTS
ncbi:hypothetical protein HanIR_Chr03g0131441 [Helianthus annuus]|nr:hypothetical protein HanIR_Chr03g0131441 [Helianthus annuus]